MNQKQFWEHIEKTKRKDTEEHTRRLVVRLAKLWPVVVIDFAHWWNKSIHEAYDWNLWGAAYIIHGGCSDDGFHYFCQWLILQGRDVFRAAVKKPDSLAKVLDPAKDFTEAYSSPATDAWFAATGLPQNDKGYDAFHAALEACHGESEPMPDLGDDWDHEDDEEMQKRFPRLWALYNEDADGE